MNTTTTIEPAGPVTSDPHPDQKAADEQAAGLRALADMIEANPDLVATKFYLSGLHVWHATDADTMAKLVRAGLAHGAKIDKAYSGDSFNLKLSWGPVVAMALGYRNQVCERVVTGVETVTKTVPDPEALAAVPQVEVTEQVETVTWVCKPLLAAEEPAAVTG